mmetsp:Transcript_45720/g.103250  ORF Transcript_45720/g.103250 Transcript_45720/m.103250 type:complete len:368 (-) Transcript_45720:362-1465(-)
MASLNWRVRVPVAHLSSFSVAPRLALSSNLPCRRDPMVEQHRSFTSSAVSTIWLTKSSSPERSQSHTSMRTTASSSVCFLKSIWKCWSYRGVWEFLTHWLLGSTTFITSPPLPLFRLKSYLINSNSSQSPSSPFHQGLMYESQEPQKSTFGRPKAHTTQMSATKSPSSAFSIASSSILAATSEALSTLSLSSLSESESSYKDPTSPFSAASSSFSFLSASSFFIRSFSILRCFFFSFQFFNRSAHLAFIFSFLAASFSLSLRTVSLLNSHCDFSFSAASRISSSFNLSLSLLPSPLPAELIHPSAMTRSSLACSSRACATASPTRTPSREGQKVRAVGTRPLKGPSRDGTCILAALAPLVKPSLEGT